MRPVVIALGLLFVLGALLLLLVGVSPVLAIYVAVEGTILLAAVMLERWKGHTRVDRAHGHWQATGERFVDPGSGRLTEVRYNPDTGERDYVDLGPAPRA